MWSKGIPSCVAQQGCWALTELEEAVDAVGHVQLTYDLWGPGAQRPPHCDPTQLLQTQRMTWGEAHAVLVVIHERQKDFFPFSDSGSELRDLLS